MTPTFGPLISLEGILIFSEKSLRNIVSLVGDEKAFKDPNFKFSSIKDILNLVYKSFIALICKLGGIS